MLQPIIESEGPKYASKNRIHQRMRQRSTAERGFKGGPSKASSTYSIIGVDSVRTRSPCTIAGIVPSGLIARYAGLVLVELQQVQIVAFVVHALLGQGQHRLAGVRVRFPVVEPEHADPCVTPAKAYRRSLAADSTEREIARPRGCRRGR